MSILCLKKTEKNQRMEAAQVEEFSNRIAVVTGAARGIGAEFARCLARQGAKVVAADILDCAPVIREIRDAGGIAIAVQCDVSSSEEVPALCAACEAEFGSANILVNNAGLHPRPQPFEELSFEYWRKTMAVNLDSMFLTTQAFYPAMRASGWGRIVNISSSSANTAPPNGAPYVASKLGVVGLTRATATEFGPHGITVNSISPNPVRTPGADGALTEEMFQQIAASQPVPIVMEPQDLAGALLFLCSDAARFVTGQNLHVDGGTVRAG